MCETAVNHADMVKLADTLDLGSNAERCAGSSPVIRTNNPTAPAILLASRVRYMQGQHL